MVGGFFNGFLETSLPTIRMALRMSNMDVGGCERDEGYGWGGIYGWEQEWWIWMGVVDIDGEKAIWHTFLNGWLGKKRVWVLNLFSAAPRNFLGHVIFLNLDGWLKLSGWYSNTKNPPTMGKKNPEIIYIWFNYGRIFVTFEMIFISEVFPDYFI